MLTTTNTLVSLFETSSLSVFLYSLSDKVSFFFFFSLKYIILDVGSISRPESQILLLQACLVR